jgi:NAD(P)-dependent dehydrogenase (short-subunit alcohol dehydrogenase family)
MSEIFSRNALAGQTAVITGGGGHLGRAAAYALAKAGCTVFITGRSSERLQQALNEAPTEAAGNIRAVDLDVTREEDLNRLAIEIQSQVGSVNIVVNNAHAGRTGSLNQISRTDFFQVFDINCVAPFLLTRALFDLLRTGAENGNASVINICSMYGKVSPDPSIYPRPEDENPVHYGAAKAALLQMTRYLAVSYAPQRIRVNSISPGPFPEASVAECNPELYQNLLKKTPLGRIGRADEFGAAVVFLGSSASSFITGADIAVDGGWTAW